MSVWLDSSTASRYQLGTSKPYDRKLGGAGQVFVFGMEKVVTRLSPLMAGATA